MKLGKAAAVFHSEALAADPSKFSITQPVCHALARGSQGMEVH